MTTHFFTRWTAGFALMALLGACATKPPIDTTPKAPLSAPYSGLFISSGCTELETGLYYADALELKPRDERMVDANYIKVFFSTPKCERNSQLIKFNLPPATWEVIGQTLIDGKQMDQVIVTLTVGKLQGDIANPNKVKETDTSFVITFGDKNTELPLQKETEGSVEKELRLIEDGRLYMSDSESPLTPDGFPTRLLPPEDHFKKQ